ncbi:mucin-5AC-like [Sycon ciliatum]|uniref:mucin-5AC-like n=1 Tax=Sycon ciliatum TaxID=27933 RepID=UPI0031F68BBD
MPHLPSSLDTPYRRRDSEKERERERETSLSSTLIAGHLPWPAVGGHNLVTSCLFGNNARMSWYGAIANRVASALPGGYFSGSHGTEPNGSQHPSVHYNHGQYPAQPYGGGRRDYSGAQYGPPTGYNYGQYGGKEYSTRSSRYEGTSSQPSHRYEPYSRSSAPATNQPYDTSAYRPYMQGGSSAGPMRTATKTSTASHRHVTVHAPPPAKQSKSSSNTSSSSSSSSTNAASAQPTKTASAGVKPPAATASSSSNSMANRSPDATSSSGKSAQATNKSSAAPQATSTASKPSTITSTSNKPPPAAAVAAAGTSHKPPQAPSSSSVSPQAAPATSKPSPTSTSTETVAKSTTDTSSVSALCKTDNQPTMADKGSDSKNPTASTHAAAVSSPLLIDLVTPEKTLPSTSASTAATRAATTVSSDVDLITPAQATTSRQALAKNFTQEVAATKTPAGGMQLDSARHRVAAAMTPLVGRNFMVTPGQDYFLTPDTVMQPAQAFSNSSFFYYDSEIKLNESNTVEFKAAGGGKSSNYYRDVFPDHVDRYVSGFLNSHNGGWLMMGVSDNGRVCGTFAPPHVQRHMEDTLRDRLFFFRPRVSTKYYNFSFRPVYTRHNRHMQDLYVAIIEVHPLKASSDVTTIFETKDRRAYMKCDGSVQELTVQKIVEHVKASYDKVLRERLAK